MDRDEQRFEARLEEIAGQLLLRLPAQASQRLPARGMVMGEGRLNARPFVAPLEPDGRGGHLLEISHQLADACAIKPGDQLSISLRPAKAWPEPPLLPGFQAALEAQGLVPLFNSLTVKARWEWHRWARNSKNPATLDKHINTAMDKLNKGMRRPCCFNTAACTLPQVSKGGVLMDE